jgi:hypothetical protein
MTRRKYDDLRPARGERKDWLIVRMACEGIPIRAIGRCLNKTADEVREPIEEAHRQGLVRAMPAEDWAAGLPKPAPSRIVSGGFVERHTALTLRVQVRLPHVPRFEARFIAALILLEQASHIELSALIREDRPLNLDSLKQLAHKSRKLLFALGFDMQTLWGTGYFIPPEALARLCAKIEWPPKKQEGADAVAA